MVFDASMSHIIHNTPIHHVPVHHTPTNHIDYNNTSNLHNDHIGSHIGIHTGVEIFSTPHIAYDVTQFHGHISIGGEHQYSHHADCRNVPLVNTDILHVHIDAGISGCVVHDPHGHTTLTGPDGTGPPKPYIDIHTTNTSISSTPPIHS